MNAFTPLKHLAHLMPVLLFLATGGAAAQPEVGTAPCGSQVNPHEIFLEGFANWDLTVYDSDGVPIPANISWPYSITSRANCDLIIDGDTDASHSDIQLDLANDDVVVFELIMDPGGPEGGSVARYFSYGGGSAQNVFYKPDGFLTTNGDYYIEQVGSALRFSPDDLWNINGQVRFLDDVFPDDNWVMRYDFDAVCDALGLQGSCYTLDNDERQFLSPQTEWPNPQSQSPTYRFSGLTDIVRDANNSDTWDVPGLTLEFPARTRLIAEGFLKMEGITLTEAVEDEGWYGVLYEPNGGGVIRDVTIENFGHTTAGSGLAAPIVCGLTVNDRWLAVYRSTIQGGHHGAYGACAFGDQAQLSLRKENNVRTEVMDNEGHGLYAYGQGRIFLRNGRSVGNGGHGALSLGTGTVIYAFDSEISNNGGVGLASLYDGNVLLYNPNGPEDGGNLLDFNLGGGLLSQNLGSYINAGTWTVGCSSACDNDLLNHDLSPSPFDAKATSGTLIFAEYNFWGLGRDDRSDLTLIELGSGVIEVDPIKTNASIMRGGPTYVQMPAEPSGLLETARALVVAAVESVAQGRWTLAFAHAQTALALARTDDELEMALGAVSILAGQPDSPELPFGLVQAVEAHLGIGQHGRPFALRSLLTADRTQGRNADARGIAQVLAAEFPRTEHALTGLAQEVDLALRADDLPSAQTALATMEVDFPEELLTEAARAYFVLRVGEDALPPRAPSTPLVASAGGTNASAPGEQGGFVLHAAYPNPFNPHAVIAYELATAGHVHIAVFDLLGRQVAALVDDRAEAGTHRAVFDGSQLASGVYVVKVSVEPGVGGATSTFTQQISLLK